MDLERELKAKFEQLMAQTVALYDDFQQLAQDASEGRIQGREASDALVFKMMEIRDIHLATQALAYESPEFAALLQQWQEKRTNPQGSRFPLH